MSSHGRLFVISAPSGSGKTTLIKRLLTEDPLLRRSISVTTRPIRKGEKPGRDYRFVNLKDFLRQRRQGRFLETAKILGHWYGTPLKPVRRLLSGGKDVVLVIDVQGAEQVRRSGLRHTTVFLSPPSLGVLRQRLARRGTETGRQIQARLKLARWELAKRRTFDYAVVNDSLKEAVDQVRAIVTAERCRVRR